MIPGGINTKVIEARRLDRRKGEEKLGLSSPLSVV